MKRSDAAARPPIDMIDTEAEALARRALEIRERLPQVSEMRLGEIERATLHEAANIPPDVVTMNATVDFIDEANGTERTVRLVYPKGADISQGRISILTPVGAGLIGLRQGQSIVWPDRDGHERRLTIVRVAQAASAL